MCRAGCFGKVARGNSGTGSEIDWLSDSSGFGGGAGADWRRDSQGDNTKETPCQILCAVREAVIAWLLKSGRAGAGRDGSAVCGLPAAETRRRLLHIRWARGRCPAGRGTSVLRVSSEGELE